MKKIRKGSITNVDLLPVPPFWVRLTSTSIFTLEPAPNMEQSAATAFGITAAASGVVGVPMGGKLADKVLARYVGGDSNGGGDGAVDDSLRNPIAASLMGKVWVLVLLALLVIFPTLAIDSPAPFLSLLFLGWTLLFGTQTSITLTAMLSVDRSHRPNALVR